jgi:hypothetical protein
VPPTLEIAYSTNPKLHKNGKIVLVADFYGLGANKSQAGCRLMQNAEIYVIGTPG